MIPDPILIVSLPRSGSSMVAGAFAKHGAWVGTCQPPDEGNARGYFENQHIAKLIGSTSGHLVHRGKAAPKIPDWRSMVSMVIQADGYDSGPWLWKGSAVYAPLWHEFDPTWVVVRRDLDAIERSGAACGRYQSNRQSVQAHLDIMEGLEARGAAVVDSAVVVGGDMTSLEAALEGAGFTPDTDALHEWVDPELWRYGG